MIVQAVSPFRCRMWDLHDRMGESIDRKSCASLIDSFEKHGQRRPVLGRPLRADACDYELIFGARRLFVAQHLGVDLLVEVRELDDQAALIEMDTENRVRADISPYERGKSYRRWLSAGLFRNQSEMAKALAVSEAQVSRLLRFAELPAVVVRAFEAPSQIREEWAVALAKICADPESRASLTSRARRAGLEPGARSPQATFDMLMSVRGPKSPPPCRPRDDVVKDPRGRPLFRVRLRAKEVHLLLPRAKVNPDQLNEINEHIKRVLGAGYEIASEATGARRPNRDGAPTRRQAGAGANGWASLRAPLEREL